MDIQTPVIAPDRLAALQTAALALDVLMVAHEGIHHAFFKGGRPQEAVWHTAELLRICGALREVLSPELVDHALEMRIAEEAYAGQPGTVLGINPGSADRTVEWEGPSHEA